MHTHSYSPVISIFMQYHIPTLQELFSYMRYISGRYCLSVELMVYWSPAVGIAYNENFLTQYFLGQCRTSFRYFLFSKSPTLLMVNKITNRRVEKSGPTNFQVKESLLYFHRQIFSINVNERLINTHYIDYCFVTGQFRIIWLWNFCHRKQFNDHSIHSIW